MGHPTQRFSVALYEGATLLEALQALPAGASPGRRAGGLRRAVCGD